MAGNHLVVREQIISIGHEEPRIPETKLVCSGPDMWRSRPLDEAPFRGRFNVDGNAVIRPVRYFRVAMSLGNDCQEKRGVLTTGLDSSLIATIADRFACGTGVGK